MSDRTKVVQPLESGVIRAIHVRDGDRVTAGQILIELDPTAATADRQSVEAQHRAALDEATRAEALLQALHSGSSPPVSNLGAAARAQLVAEWGDIEAKLARLDAEMLRREAELATVKQLVTKLQATLPMARQRESDIRALVDQGFMSGHAGQDQGRTVPANVSRSRATWPPSKRG